MCLILEVKFGDNQLDNTEGNNRSVNQELYEHLSPEQSQKEHQYFRPFQLRITDTKSH